MPGARLILLGSDASVVLVQPEKGSGHSPKAPSRVGDRHHDPKKAVSAWYQWPSKLEGHHGFAARARASAATLLRPAEVTLYCPTM